MAKSGNLYDMPFERRIRIKYFLFGACLAFSAIGALSVISLIGDIVLSSMGYIVMDYSKHLFSVFLMFAPLTYYQWYSKSKPHKHQYLNETIGLKQDYEKVSGV